MIGTSCEKWWTAQTLESFRFQVDRGYGYALAVDGLPAALSMEGRRDVKYNVPVPVGFKQLDGGFCVYNHLHFDLQVAPSSEDATRVNIVSFAVKPLSIDHQELDRQDSLLAAKAKSGNLDDIAAYLEHQQNALGRLESFQTPQRLTDGKKFKFTYSSRVLQAQDGLVWANRLLPYG